MTRLRSLLRNLAEYEVVLVVLAAVISAAAERFLWPALAVIGSGALLRWVGTGRLSRRTPLDFGILGLALMSIATLFVTVIPEKTLPQVLRLWVAIGLFYSLVNWLKTVRRVEIGIASTAFSGVVLAGLALLSVAWVTDKIRALDFAPLYAVPNLISDRIHPNVMGGNLAVLAPLPLALAIFGRKTFGWPARLLFGAFFLGMAGVLVLTQSRGAYLALAASLFLMAWLWSPWAGGVLILAGLGGLAVLYAVGFDFTRAFYAFLYSGGDVFADTMIARTEIWARATHILRDFPYTGIGMGCFEDVMNLMYPIQVEPVPIGHAHQLILQIGVDLGIPGLIAWVVCFATVVVISWRMVRSGRQQKVGWLSAIGAGSLCSAAALLVNGMLDAVTWGTRAAFIPWLVWGVCAGAWSAWKHKDKNRS